MGLFKKRSKIAVTDFMCMFHQGHGDVGLYPVYKNGRIKWVNTKTIPNLSYDKCAICGRSMGTDDIGMFIKWANLKYDVDVFLPINICFDCGVDLYDTAVKNIDI